mmetsp:Transcript_1852/g.3145  ORF Transcript_1852/g.3145 Transcript_1852/m.3145 type:complete len:271 (+) Transcript_1852:686-1498(+)
MRSITDFPWLLSEEDPMASSSLRRRSSKMACRGIVVAAASDRYNSYTIFPSSSFVSPDNVKLFIALDKSLPSPLPNFSKSLAMTRERSSCLPRSIVAKDPESAIPIVLSRIFNSNAMACVPSSLPPSFRVSSASVASKASISDLSRNNLLRGSSHAPVEEDEVAAAAAAEPLSERPIQPVPASPNDSNATRGSDSSSITASAFSFWAPPASTPSEDDAPPMEGRGGGGSGVVREGRPSEVKTASPPASSAESIAVAMMFFEQSGTVPSRM